MNEINTKYVSLVAFTLLVGIFYTTNPGTKDFILFTILTAMLIGLLSVCKHYYIKDENSLKEQIIYMCLSMVLLSIYYILVLEIISFPLDYKLFILIWIGSILSVLRRHLNLSYMENAVLLITVITIFSVSVYDDYKNRPTTIIDFYFQNIINETTYEGLQNLYVDSERPNFTKETYNELSPFLNNPPRRFHLPVLLEYAGGRTILLVTEYSEEYETLQIRNISILPEELVSLFK
ncbi:hypothetical protein [Desulfuribacillus alkaliarsenatis]|uniref:Uncharacterized protein n=1 Tax=Desulfuribacillus alkaliarsenatis TaxID=766136 RepID=A0A1E5FZY9_9FIRM|nr:hypothetical protein [Desulfuribacillus alkaliarsenatis]OEF96124.1 hypothetical protein BHF68_10355 [Desulfuribacillus alkaliarsenatis]